MPRRADGENALNGGELGAGADALTTLSEQHGLPAAADVDPARSLERSRELLERALEIFDQDSRSGDQDARVRVLLNLGATYAGRYHGDPAANQERAISLQRQVLELVSLEDDGRAWAMAHTNLGLSLLHRERVIERAEEGELDDGAELPRQAITDAIGPFEQALTWRSFARDPLDWGYTQINLALAYDRRGDLLRAIEHNSEAIRGFAAAGHTLHEAQALHNRAGGRRALAERDTTEPQERAALLADAEQDARAAIAVVGPDVDGTDAGRRWLQLARVLAARDGSTDESRTTCKRALKELTPRAAPRECREAGRLLAELAADAGDWRVAAEGWEQAAIAGAAAVESRATRGGRIAEIAENGTVFRWAAYALTRSEALEQAVEILELGRGRELASWLQHDVVDLEPLRHADPRLCGRFVELRERVDGLERAGATVDDPAVAGAVEELGAVIEEIRSLPGEETFLKRPSLADLTQGLPVDETIAYPILTPHGSAWLLLASGAEPPVSVIDLPALTSTAALRAMLRIDHEAGAVHGYLVEQSVTGDWLDQEIAVVSRLLGPALMRPLASALAEREATEVCIVPLGPLGLLPVHALTWDEGGRARCLLDLVDVTCSPSAYVRHVCHARAAQSGFKRLVAVGNPLPHSLPLPGAEYEAASVSATVPATDTVLLVGEEATKEAVVGALVGASHIHLACHGCAAGNSRELDAALSFDHDRAMSGAEILDLDLSRARLVVAAACETAQIADYETVDETLTLATVFVAAGAAGVVATLWSVDDYATSLLMTRFYEELVALADTPARALRSAQLWLRDLDEDEEQRYAARHPALSEQRARRAVPGEHSVPSSEPGSDRSRRDGSAGFGVPTAWAA